MSFQLAPLLAKHPHIAQNSSMSSIKRDVKKKVLPRPEGEKILSRDPAHFTVRASRFAREVLLLTCLPFL